MQEIRLVTVYYRSRVTGLVREFKALEKPELYLKLDELPGVSLIEKDDE